MVASDFLQKLSKSASVLSLRAEQSVCRVLTRRKWKCFQGAYYLDLKDNKLRETDVIARRMWARGAGGEKQVARLSLVIEVKSAKEWHLLFAGRTNKMKIGHTLRVWPGHMGVRYDWLREVLRRCSVPEEAVPSLLTRFEELAFPEESAILSDLFVDVPRARTIATSFRETNIDKEKDLETSVLWRAMSALRSATNSLTHEVHSWHEENFGLLERTRHGSDEFTEEFDSACNRTVQFVDFFHPVVVIDACPWIAHGSRPPRQAPTCRFYQLDPIGSVTWWCDVVHSGAFEQFAADTTTFYDAFYRRCRAQRKVIDDY